MSTTHPETSAPVSQATQPPLTTGIRQGLAWVEEAVYILVGLVLLAAAALIVIGTVSALIHAIRTGQSAVNTGILLLDRILLMLIVAELMHTLRFVVLRGRIVVEPFLFVGLIAAVRRVLIITAELEHQSLSGRALTNQLLELGLLGGLALALAVSIFLIRRSGPAGYDPAEGEPSLSLVATARPAGNSQGPVP